MSFFNLSAFIEIVIFINQSHTINEVITEEVFKRAFMQKKGFLNTQQHEFDNLRNVQQHSQQQNFLILMQEML